MSACQPTPRVLNRRTTYDRNPRCVYVGRPTKWGNPFEIGRDGTRDEVVDKYRAWLPTSGLDPRELKGKDLVCWCAPQRCHADVLLELANAPEVDEQAIFNCAGCGAPILTFWAPNGGGLLPGEYTLAGDTIWHPKCWDAHVAPLFTESASEGATK